jgi:hypothetical protein
VTDGEEAGCVTRWWRPHRYAVVVGGDGGGGGVIVMNRWWVAVWCGKGVRGEGGATATVKLVAATICHALERPF